MKVLQVTRQFYPSVGGIENVVLGLCQALHRAGHRSDVATLRWIYDRRERAAPREALDGIYVYRLPHIGSRRYPVAPAVLSLTSAYDVIHIHAIDFFIDFLGLTRFVHRRPMVVNTHGGIFHTRWLWPFKQAFFRTVTRLSLRAARAVICDSPADRNLFLNIVPDAKLHVIPNGVDVEAFLKVEKRVAPGLLLGLGRVAENKGIEAVIELLPALVPGCSSVQLVWIGDDSQQRVPHLMARAQQLGVAERVRFLGRRPLNEVQEWLSRAHLFVSLARYEAFGVSTIEAMSSGTVPVVTPVGIHPEVVQDGETGFLCPFDKAQACACLGRALALDLPALAQMGAKARQAGARFSWSGVVSSYLSVYESALESAAHAA